MNLWKRMRLAGRVLMRGADGTDMPDGIKPPKRGPATEPLQLSTVFRGVQVLQTAITGLPIVEQRGGRDLPDVSPMVLQPDVSRSRRDFIADIVASRARRQRLHAHRARLERRDRHLRDAAAAIRDRYRRKRRPSLPRPAILLHGTRLRLRFHRAQQVPQRARPTARTRPHLGGTRGRSMPHSSRATTRRSSSRTARTSRAICAHQRTSHRKPRSRQRHHGRRRARPATSR